MPTAEELRQAVALLSRAAGPVARVQRLSAETGNGALIRVEDTTGKAAGLRLVPWGEPAPEKEVEERVWVLRRGTRRLRQQLRERDENFIDLSGAVRLNLRWLIIDRTDLEPIRLRARIETRNPFSDRGSLILRTMFETGPNRVWTVGELAESAEVSLGLVSYVSSALARRHLVKVQRVGRTKQIRLTDPVAAIEQWTREYDWKRNTAVAFHAPVGSPERFLRRLPDMLEGCRWALTLQAGASLVAPHATWDIIHLYTDAEDEDELLVLGQSQDWEPAEGGKVVLLAPLYKHSIWHGSRRIKGLPVVSNLQLVLDLWHYPIRGREQAEHLISSVLMRRRVS